MTPPEFADLDRAAVEAALADPDPRNPVAVEVARLVGVYTDNFTRHCQRLGRVPTTLTVRRPDTAIEEVAMRLASQTIADALGVPLRIAWVGG